MFNWRKTHRVGAALSIFVFVFEKCLVRISDWPSVSDCGLRASSQSLHVYVVIIPKLSDGLPFQILTDSLIGRTFDATHAKLLRASQNKREKNKILIRLLKNTILIYRAKFQHMIKMYDTQYKNNANSHGTLMRRGLIIISEKTTK
jgi:hypothetical protein